MNLWCNLPTLFKRVGASLKWATQRVYDHYTAPPPLKALPAPAKSTSQLTMGVIGGQRHRGDGTGSGRRKRTKRLSKEPPAPPDADRGPVINVTKTFTPKKTSPAAPWPHRTWRLGSAGPGDLLNDERQVLGDDHEELVRAKAKILEGTLAEFKIEAGRGGYRYRTGG